MLYAIILVGFCGFVFSMVLTPVCRNLFRRLGFVDRPDQDRKLHQQPIPHMGGVPIALSYLGGLALLALVPRELVPIQLSHVLFALPAGIIIFTTGILDDIYRLRPWQKLLGQLAGSLWAFWAGVRVTSIAGLHVGWWGGLAITVIWLIGCTNAFNLIDGVDGLASGVGLFAIVTMLFAALLQHSSILALATAPLAGALMGFLRYNFNPASIFLGDSGSLMIGFLLGCFGVVWGEKSATILGMTAPLMALSIPILDTGLSIVRRFLRHQPIFAGDRDHIHHRLLNRGLTPRNVALVLYGMAGIGATLSLLSVADNRMSGAIVLLFCGAAWIGIQHLGYAEFSTAGHMLFTGVFQDALDARLRLRTLEENLLAAESLDECWEQIVEACRSFDFVEVRLRVGERSYHLRLVEADPDDCWCVRIPIPEVGYINFTRPTGSIVLPMGVAPFVDVVRKAMYAKCRGTGPGAVLGAGSVMR